MDPCLDCQVLAVPVPGIPLDLDDASHNGKRSWGDDLHMGREIDPGDEDHIVRDVVPGPSVIHGWMEGARICVPPVIGGFESIIPVVHCKNSVLPVSEDLIVPGHVELGIFRQLDTSPVVRDDVSLEFIQGCVLLQEDAAPCVVHAYVVDDGIQI